MAITNLPTKLTSAGNQGDAGDYSTAASTVFQIDYSGLDYTPKTTDDYKNDFEEELQVFINGTRIYRTATDTGIDDAGGLSTAQKSRLTNLNSSFGNEPWDIVTGTKKVQINQTHTAFGDSDSNNPGYPALDTWTIIKVIRIKPDKSTLATDFQSASVLTEAELDNTFSETFHLSQESIDIAQDSMTLGTDNIWDADNKNIKNIATPSSSDPDHYAVNKGYVDTSSATQIVAGKISPTDFITPLSNVSSQVAILGTTDAVADMAVLGTADVVNDMNVLGTSDNVANMNTLADNITDVNAVAGTIAGSLTYTVTVAGGVFVLDGANNPTITLTRGFTYTFDQSEGTNAGHLLLFKDSAGNAYTNGVTTSGTLGQAGAKTVFVVPANAPDSLRYYCQTHGNSMGNTITVANNDLGEVASVGAGNINTLATNAQSSAIVMAIALG